MTRSAILLTTSTLLVNTIHVGAIEWPGFGGARGDFSVATRASDQAGMISAPVPLWSRELGFGNSGIVVYDRTIYTMHREVDAEGAIGSQETVGAYDADTGDTVWVSSYEQKPLEGQNDYGGGHGPHATPFVTADRLFTLGYAGSLHCFERGNGRPIWKLSLVEDYGAEPVQFGFSASPIVVDGRLIVQAAGVKGGLLALDPGTGKPLWHSAPAGPSYATPVLMEIAGEAQLVFLSRDFVQGIRVKDGEVRWQYPLPKKDLTNVPTPLILGNGRIFIAGQGVGGAEVIQVTRDGFQFTVSRVWRNSRVNFFHSSFIRQGDLVFGGDSFLYAVNLKNGDRLWAERGYENANVVGLGGGALLLTRDGRLVVARLDAKGVQSLQSVRVLEEEAWTPPTVAGERVYARNREALVALSFSERPVGTTRSYLSEKARLAGLAAAGNQGAVEEVLRDWGGRTSTPVSLSSQLRLSQRLIESGDTAAAATLLRALSTVNPTSVVALGKLGRLALIEGDRPAARMAYSNAVARDPQFNEGRRILRQLAEDRPTDGNVLLTLKGFEQARLVTVAGSFNGWNSFHTLLRPTGSGWTTAIELPAGEYEYKFVVDGNWMLDPKNPRKKSGRDKNVNSLLTVE